MQIATVQRPAARTNRADHGLRRRRVEFHRRSSMTIPERVEVTAYSGRHEVDIDKFVLYELTHWEFMAPGVRNQWGGTDRSKVICRSFPDAIAAIEFWLAGKAAGKSDRDLLVAVVPVAWPREKSLSQSGPRIG